LDNHDYFAPPVPSPNKNYSIPLDSENLSDEILKKIEKIDSNVFKPVILKCDRCDTEILITIPINPILESKKSELLTVFLHKNVKKKDLHCLIFEIDHNFNVLLPKTADTVISTLFSQKEGNSFNHQKSPDIKYVLINCEKCAQNILVPIPIKIIENSNIPKTPIAYIHKKPNEDYPHCIILYLDENFGDRDTRTPDILLLNLFSY
jgi:hypothetical protein